MTDSVNISAGHSELLLKGTTTFVRSLKIVWIILGALTALGFVIGYASSNLKSLDLDLTETISAIAYLAVVNAFIHYIGAIVHSIRKGDPFTSENANRLRKLGWMFLIIGIFTCFFDIYEVIDNIGEDAKLVKDYVIYVIGFVYLITNPTLLLASPLMFILARVFDVGIAMREDAEGTV